jgi:hypothetical protein
MLCGAGKIEYGYKAADGSFKKVVMGPGDSTYLRAGDLHTVRVEAHDVPYCWANPCWAACWAAPSPRANVMGLVVMTR